MPLHLIYILLLPAGSKMVCSEFQAIFYEWYKIFGIKKNLKICFGNIWFWPTDLWGEYFKTLSKSAVQLLQYQ